MEGLSGPKHGDFADYHTRSLVELHGIEKSPTARTRADPSLKFRGGKITERLNLCQQCFEARQKPVNFGWVAQIKMSKGAARPANFHRNLILQSGECSFVCDVV